MLCLELNWFCYDTSRMLHLSEFVTMVFSNFLCIDATDRRKISSDQKRIFIASFFANTPFKYVKSQPKIYKKKRRILGKLWTSNS